METKKHKPDNYSSWDVVYLYPPVDYVSKDIIVKIRKYQSLCDFKNTQSALIEVWNGSSHVLTLEDDGNGIDTNLGSRLDYCNAQYLTYALLSYEDLSKWKRTSKRIDL